MTRLPAVRAALTLTFLAGLAGGVSGQAPASADRPAPQYPIDVETAPRPTMRAVRISTPIVIDGAIDEEAWDKAEPVDEFIQSKPQIGYPASERTVVRVVYDDEKIYISAVCYDSEPHKAVVTTLEQDFDTPNSDNFGVVLDTFHDKRNGYFFQVNPRGALKDSQVFDDSRYENREWEGVTQQATKMYDDRWTVELAIPFTTLRFDPSSADQTWGVNFLRRIRRKNEDLLWAPLDRRDFVHRMSKAGTMLGLAGLRKGRNLQIKPFALGSNTTGSLRAADANATKGDAGVDVKYGVTPSMTLDLTYRTDFSQIEVDQEQVNLTRFSLFFPEKRDFFMENAGIFQFGDLNERALRMGAGPRDFALFHSRQIGLTDAGGVIPIVGGGRLTGSAGGFEIGVLNMQTEDSAGAAGENFSVLRLRRALPAASDVGMMFVGSEKTGDGQGPAYSRSYGFDLNLRPRRNMILQTYLAATQDPAATGNQTASRFTVGFRDNVWNTSAFFKQIGDGFNPGVGFVSRRDMRQTYATFGAHPRPGLSWIEEVNPYVEINNITDLESVLQTRTGTLGFDTLFKDGSRLFVEHRDNFERVEEPFRVSRATIPVGEYDFRENAITYNSSAGRGVSARTSLTVGDYYGGEKTSLNVGALWRANPQLLLDVSLNRNDITLDGESFAADVYGLRVRGALSTTFFANAFFQYNAAAEQSVVNVRFDWMHSPLSDLFVAYTERRNTAGGGGILERVISVKLTKMLAF